MKTKSINYLAMMILFYLVISIITNIFNPVHWNSIAFIAFISISSISFIYYSIHCYEHQKSFFIKKLLKKEKKLNKKITILRYNISQINDENECLTCKNIHLEEANITLHAELVSANITRKQILNDPPLFRKGDKIKNLTIIETNIANNDKNPQFPYDPDSSEVNYTYIVLNSKSKEKEPITQEELIKLEKSR